MASFRGHLAFSAALGAGYGSVAAWEYNLDWGPVFLGSGLTALGGFLPDLDSDSGVPVRELFSIAAVVGALLMVDQLRGHGFTLEQTTVVLGGIYLFIRFKASAFFKRYTIHRGMYHSIPAMLIAGLAVFLAYHGPALGIRLFMAGGLMLGFLSHLVLDEVYSVDFDGLRVVLKASAGSALKFYSDSWSANLQTYTILAVLGYLASLEYVAIASTLRNWAEQFLRTWPW